MNCEKCGAPIEPGKAFCPRCGAAVAPVSPAATHPAYAQPTVTVVQQTETSLPPQNRPLSAWAYWGLSLLYSVPVIGFIFLIVFSFNKSNINRRNFSRSYFCWLLIFVIIMIVLVILALTGVISEDALEAMRANLS